MFGSFFFRTFTVAKLIRVFSIMVIQLAIFAAPWANFDFSEVIHGDTGDHSANFLNANSFCCEASEVQSDDYFEYVQLLELKPLTAFVLLLVPRSHTLVDQFSAQNYSRGPPVQILA
ncbi:MAG: hypothetical protein ABL888_01655 [Pirellulaceae bacterium]